MFVIPIGMLRQTGPFSYELNGRNVGLKEGDYPTEIFVDGLTWTSTMMMMYPSSGRSGWWYLQNGTTVKVEIFNDR